MTNKVGAFSKQVKGELVVLQQQQENTLLIENGGLPVVEPRRTVLRIAKLERRLHNSLINQLL